MAGYIGYSRLQGVAAGYSRLQEVMAGYKRLQKVYKLLR